MGAKKTLVQANLEDIIKIYERTGSYTKTAREFCKAAGESFSDKWRRCISREINEHFEDDVVYQELKRKNNQAKILIFDIETAPALSYIWGAWNQNPGSNLSMIQNEWFMFSWAAKWLFEEDVMSDKLTSKEAVSQSDGRLVKGLWDLIEEADIVVAHNALKFDVKRMNTRFLKAGLMPPMPYQVIDTLVHARRKFALLSNKLDHLADFLDLEGKMKHSGFSLWDRCYKGEPEALEEMEVYNIQDIAVLEEVYLKLRPWINPHPNIGLFVEDDVQACPACGSDSLDWSGTKPYRTYVNEYSAFRCNNCGSVGRSRKSDTTAQQKKNLTVSVPK